MAPPCVRSAAVLGALSAASVQVQAPAVPGLVASQARHVQVKLRA